MSGRKQLDSINQSINQSINLFGRISRATEQNEEDSQDNDITDSCPTTRDDFSEIDKFNNCLSLSVILALVVV